MGMVMSFMGKGTSSTQMFNLLMGTLYTQFTEKDINTFEDFHQAFLDIFNTVNSALPGRHYDTPSRKEVEACYHTWEQSNWSDRKRVFVELVKKTMNLSRLDDATMMTGIVTPPAAMAAKKAGENVPQMSMIKAIPDVIFVPSVTLIALITAKLSRKIIQRKKSSIPEASPPAVRPSPPAAEPPEEFASRPVEVPTCSSDTPREPPPPSPQNQSTHQTIEPPPPPPPPSRSPLQPSPSPQNQSTHQTIEPPPPPPPPPPSRSPLPPPSRSPLRPSPSPQNQLEQRPSPSPQNQPSVPAIGPSWPWYSPTPQPGFPRTRQPQPQYSSALPP